MTYADSSSQYQMSSKELAVQISIWPTAELFILDLKHNISNPSFKKEPCITQYMVTSIFYLKLFIFMEEILQV